jgi:hypothetical protein
VALAALAAGKEALDVAAVVIAALAWEYVESLVSHAYEARCYRSRLFGGGGGP